MFPDNKIRFRINQNTLESSSNLLKTTGTRTILQSQHNARIKT